MSSTQATLEATSAPTPGPWEARTFEVRGGAGMNDRICHVGTTTSLAPSRSYETFANARLIAAAPEMLAALRQLEKNISSETFPELPTPIGSLRNSMLEIVRHAIANATGGVL